MAAGSVLQTAHNITPDQMPGSLKIRFIGNPPARGKAQNRLRQALPGLFPSARLLVGSDDSSMVSDAGSETPCRSAEVQCPAFRDISAVKALRSKASPCPDSST
ncbi:hypothetical protein KCP78_14170 [Salmonella enterica subsp. enterica]|nr:hypothetical protein KCP78_14170 [Salmonella enterica subsp. enterica]